MVRENTKMQLRKSNPPPSNTSTIPTPAFFTKVLLSLLVNQSLIPLQTCPRHTVSSNLAYSHLTTPDFIQLSWAQPKNSRCPLQLVVLPGMRGTCTFARLTTP